MATSLTTFAATYSTYSLPVAFATLVWILLVLTLMVVVIVLLIHKSREIAQRVRLNEERANKVKKQASKMPPQYNEFCDDD